MTTYKRNERRQWRYSLKRFQWRINQALVGEPKTEYETGVSW